MALRARFRPRPKSYGSAGRAPWAYPALFSRSHARAGQECGCRTTRRGLVRSIRFFHLAILRSLPPESTVTSRPHPPWPCPCSSVCCLVPASSLPAGLSSVFCCPCVCCLFSSPSFSPRRPRRSRVRPPTPDRTTRRARPTPRTTPRRRTRSRRRSRSSAARSAWCRSAAGGRSGRTSVGPRPRSVSRVASTEPTSSKCVGRPLLPSLTRQHAVFETTELAYGYDDDAEFVRVPSYPYTDALRQLFWFVCACASARG